jgi:hypothetical protein
VIVGCRIVGEIADIASIGIHDIYILIGCSFFKIVFGNNEGDLFSVWRKSRIRDILNFVEIRESKCPFLTDNRAEQRDEEDKKTELSHGKFLLIEGECAIR